MPSSLTTCLWRAQVAKIQREHDAREVELRKAQEHYESVKKTAGPSAECAHAVAKRPGRKVIQSDGSSLRIKV